MTAVEEGKGMGKNNIPNGSLFSPELQETVRRLKNKEPELDALVDAGGCHPDQADSHDKESEDEET